MKQRLFVLVLIMTSSLLSCKEKLSGTQQMASILKKIHDQSKVVDNTMYPEAGLDFVDSLLRVSTRPDEQFYYKNLRAKLLTALGKEDQAISQFNELLAGDEKDMIREVIWKDLALAYLRHGERTNCITAHAAESCIIPIRGLGIQQVPDASYKAIEIYNRILAKHPDDLESRWLVNLAYMSVGQYPKGVPPAVLLPNMGGDTTYKVKPFQDIASGSRLEVKNMSGGSIIDDFDNDGYLDIMTSGYGTDESLHFFKNNANGTFTDLSSKIGLSGITGGLNMISADYNNDGFVDVFVLRGGWKRHFGKEPNSLLRNNGDGTFSDVTIESGLLSYHPTQTGTWNDFNNDGWLDLFIGNETLDEAHPCELYLSNGDGTFREIAKQANVDVTYYVKGVSSGDYNNDGWKDLFLSTISGRRILFKNNGLTGKDVSFMDVTAEAGIGKEKGNTFPTWFWDYDNDGWLDIFACDYTYDQTLGVYFAAEALKIPLGNPEKMLLYHNNHDGTFTNVANETGLTKNAFAMGSNFGDIDNDGYLDMYLGTANPDIHSLIPNKMFKSIDGKKFADVTNSARVGHLQKGHGVAFADMDNDGDQDIYIEMGGIYAGDAYQNSFFINPGQNNNNWISLKLEGKNVNKSAIGSRVKLTFRENGQARTVYRDVNTGGSFGCSPLRREIGIGTATIIDELEISWHGTGEIQTFRDVKPNQLLKIVQGSDKIEPILVKKLNWVVEERLCLPGS